MSILLILTLIGLIGASGFFSLAQVALFSLSTAETKALQKSSHPLKQQAARLLKEPHSLLMTLIMYDVACNILIQSNSAKIFPQGQSWMLIVGLPWLITLLFGEMIPKMIAFPHHTALAWRVAPWVDFFHKLSFPFLKVVDTWMHIIVKLFSVFFKPNQKITKEQLQLLLDASTQEGLVNVEELELIQGYLTLSEVTVKEIMQPRQEISYYNLQEAMTILPSLFKAEEVLVCDGSLDTIKGFLSLKTFLRYQNSFHQPQDMIAWLQAPYYVPETIQAKTLFKHFLRTGHSVAVVLNEYGTFCGLIHQSTLYQTVIGTLSYPQQALYTYAGEDAIIAHGTLEVAVFEDLFKMTLPTTHSVTLAGWLTEQMGDIPQKGTKFKYQTVLFHVLDADPHRVLKLYIRRLPVGEACP